ncbi:class I SAM-dependent methyltransferase [Microbacterium sp. EYE_5]|uniref:class I SAM-dependent methyltransferase n=1 Tax=unclassified Microbacterium TaxID=2609290 RepID=UPI0020061244|nr:MULTISPECIES: class I SAM-dependent methyltransferase [unclassified Microbacterium]MCK6081793.1 class I SAM-dependent methyltransferase [Microbacterium sp. EYE_382]MCK6087063.1 class I SAM-dependent methyltransferase [Microbacterium sp. EYE_384]MCK6124959.1 class I SAM-dependent methyltransferase [Microbacterium sp. EYE_80]MCK6127826.1 class I SAM-dependent methyltransferase [Microbacterium sp. EYE_79]MCK6142747.1 class I SAM-dependent methyltransferase [Microbacterium sp. EYE_39]
MTRAEPVVGQVTRGTTNTNRLRRVDRWIARHPVLRRTADPLVVDLGYGASGVTAFELEARLRRTRADVEVLGLEIEPARVDRANRQLEAIRAGGASFDPDARVSFARGGFEVPVAGGRRPAVIRAFNVLRQYDEADVAGAWRRMTQRLQPGGMLVEGTCDELGRISTWIEVGSDAAPRSLTISLRLAGLDSPAVAAERLPKALIHRNVPGERVHDALAALEREWTRAAPASAFGPVQRWRAALDAMASDGWPVAGRSRWRLGEVTLPWESVAPVGD